MNLRQYLSISLLRVEVLSYLVLVSDRFIRGKSERGGGKKIMVTHTFLINFLGILFIMKSMNKICAYLTLDLKKKKEKKASYPAGRELSADSGYNVGG